MEQNSSGIKTLAVLGATGSIGRQTLDIVWRHPELYRVAVLTAGSRVDELAALAAKFRPRLAVIAREEHLPRLKAALDPLGIECAAGETALKDCVTAPDIDMVLTATVGYSGLAPTVAAIKAGKDIALANKETLVVAGDLINRLLENSPSKIYPVDSEHSAVAQCLMGEDSSTVSRLLITASGGPFRTWDAERIAKATASEALKHPNWNMGAKITVDSASLMNKAFELIEAHHLFHIEPEKISAVVHPQSIIHSMVEFTDGAIKAQLGVPDMRLPIAFALGCHSRLSGAAHGLTLSQLSTLTFEEPDTERFPCIKFASLAMKQRGNTACVINAANEVAVTAFLADRIHFGSIYPLIEMTLAKASFIENPDYEDFVNSNAEARVIASNLLSHFRIWKSL